MIEFFFIACLNHIPERDREKVLGEAFRVPKPGGMIIVTMIGPKIGFLWHKLSGLFWDKDQRVRGMKEGEVYGMSQEEVDNLLLKVGFKEVSHHKFELGLNTIFLGKKI